MRPSTVQWVGLLVIATCLLGGSFLVLWRRSVVEQRRDFGFHPAAPSKEAKAPSINNEFRNWIKGGWDSRSFENGLGFASQGDARTRVLALEKLLSKRESLSELELQGFRKSLEQQVRATSDDPQVVAASVRTLVGLLDYLKSRGLLSEADLVADGELFVNYVRNDALDLQVRGAAIRGVGDLGFSSARESVEALVADPANLNTAEIARNGCLALVKLGQRNALAPVRKVFEQTTDSSIFGTAAYCLGQINTPAAMSLLIRGSDRFPDSAACDAALVNMEDVILGTLKKPESPEVLDAIKATDHLWRDGQREKYVPALRQLVADAPLPVRRASCEQLIDAASRLPFAKEKEELALVLEQIGDSAEFTEASGKIRQRMQATILKPVATAPVPTQNKE